jgi:diguanylate cyclase (GGDEF)-like protein
MTTSARRFSAFVEPDRVFARDGHLKVVGQLSISRNTHEVYNPEPEMSDNSKEKQRLLIVDDSKVIRVTARKILQDHFETIEAVDGENAWEILNSEAPVSLVVSDLTMPNLDGFGLLKRIRCSHLPHVRDLPVIIITGANDTDSTMERARQTGATDFIGKPFDAVHLLARTQAHANSHAVTNNLKEVNTTLEDKSTLDQLTGLANEAAFMERGYQQLSYAIRHDSTLTLVRMEIDRYDALYRQYGESFCESIIQTVATILGTSIRQEDIVARIGTVRFALLLPGMGKAGIRTLAERINSSIATRIFKSGNDKATVTVSIGVASPKIRRDMQLSELITIADNCLSQAVSIGGDQVIYDDDPVRTVAAIRSDPAISPEPGMMNHAKALFVEANASVPANNAHLFHINENMEVEEIEIFTTEYPYNHFSGEHKRIAEIECRSGAAPEPAANTFFGPVPGEAAFAPAAENAESGDPESPPAAPPAAEWTVIPVDPEENNGDKEGMTEILTPLFGDTTAGRNAEETAPPVAGRGRPGNRHSAIKPARYARPPGTLKRMLAWLGLIQSQ